MPVACLRLIDFWSKAIQYLSDLPLLFITISVLATTTGGLAFILLIMHLPRIVAAAFIYAVLIIAGLASAVREYYTNSACA